MMNDSGKTGVKRTTAKAKTATLTTNEDVQLKVFEGLGTALLNQAQAASSTRPRPVSPKQPASRGPNAGGQGGAA